MKNIFKIMGLALMACTLTVACGDKNEDTTTVAEGINVTFDGDSWTAAVNDCAYLSQYGAITFDGAEVDGQYPKFSEGFYATEVGSVTETASNGQFTSTNTHAWVEYYEDSYLYDNQGNNYGDWWAEQATTNIVAVDLTALTVSAEMNGTMFDASAAFVPVDDNTPAPGLTSSTPRADYSATFGNVSLSAK